MENGKMTTLHLIDNPSLSATMEKAELEKFKLFRYIRKNEVLVCECLLEGKIKVKEGFSIFSPTLQEKHVIYMQPVTLDFPKIEIPDKNMLNVIIDMDLKVQVSDPKTYYILYFKNEGTITADIRTKSKEFLTNVIGKMTLEELGNLEAMHGSMTRKEFIEKSLNNLYMEYFDELGVEVKVGSFDRPMPTEEIAKANEKLEIQKIKNSQLKQEADAANERAVARAKNDVEVADLRKQQMTIIGEAEANLLGNKVEVLANKIKAYGYSPEIEAYLLNTLYATNGNGNSKTIVIADGAMQKSKKL